MKYKKSTIALCVGSAIIAGTAMAQTTTDSKTAFAVPTTNSSQFVIQLNGQAALDHGVSNRSDYSKEANAVTEQQERLFQEILALDPNAKLLGNTRLLSNLITVELSADAVERVEALSGINSVTATPVESRSVLGTNASSINAQINAEGEEEAEEISYMYPYTGSETAGDGVTVAIISTGIDYTLPIFGGSGVYGDDNDPETPPVAGSYLDALENGAVGPTIPGVADDPDTEEDEFVAEIPGFAGFPTDVVAGGWDFTGENYGNDGNPIDQNLEYVHWNGAIYPTGMGTQLASIVHQLAPGADLYAYKVSNVMESYGSVRALWPTEAKIAQAVEHALDPNQDGDTSDHVDVVLMDASGAAAFYNQYEQSGARPILTQQLIQRASALGMTIVTHAGVGGHKASGGMETKANHRNWISWEGSAPAAITVGSAVIANDGETVAPALWSPIGPVRGSRDLKPEVMSFAKDIPVGLISNSDASAPTKSTRTDANVASARIAAAVAVIKAAHPDLGPVELKALLANTANHNIKETDASTGEVLEQAELIHIGHGLENVSAAISSPIAAWDSASNQPYLQFGFHEVADQKVIVKEITLRNFSDAAQTYALSYMANGDKAAQSALMLNYPASVSIPANRSVTFKVEMTIDGTMLPAWPVTSSEDYVDEKHLQTELNGYFQLTAEDQPELNLGWMVQARPSSSIDKNVISDEFPYSLGWNPDLGHSEWVNLAWAEQFYPTSFETSPQYFALTSSFVNESNTPTTYEVYPAILSTANPPEGKDKTYGHKIKTVGGGLYDDARCEISGKKISIAVNLWEPAHDAMANWSDKIGTSLFFYDLFSQDVLKETGADESFTGINHNDLAKGEAQLIGQPYVDIDENGQPATFYIDYNMEYVYGGPSRKKKSKLPVRITPNGKNIVSEICIEELTHHDISDAPDDFSIPLMVEELDADGNPVAEMVQCGDGWTLDELLEYGYFADYGHYYCQSSTGSWDAEGYTLNENGERIYSMVENTERGVPGQNELLNWWDQNLGFHIATDRDAQTVKHAPIAQFNPTKHGFVSAPQEVCIDSWIGGVVCEMQVLDYSVNAGFARINDDNPLQAAEFEHIITLEPGEEATIAAVSASLSRSTEFLMISSDDNFAITAPNNYVDADGGPVAAVRAGQEFSVAENAEFGTVVGQIKLDKAGFFGMTATKYTEFTMSIVNALPGSPFAIDQDTFELYVANPAAVDYENNTKFEVLVQSMQGAQALTQAAMITVHVNNLNDVAPQVVAPIAPVSASITDVSNASVSIDISTMFIDIEGESVTLTVSGLPAGLSYANGMITGETDVVGTHTITVTASDGINESSSSFDIVVVRDFAPQLESPIAPVTASITDASNASVSIDIISMFIDAEGGSVTLTVSGLPAGISYENGMISGSTDVEGVHVINVTASDGINETSTSFELVIEDQTTPVVEPEESKSSGGSFGGLLLAFAGLSLFRRRK